MTDALVTTAWLAEHARDAGLRIFEASQEPASYSSGHVEGALAIDWKTGAQVARWRFPDDSVLWNNWGGITTLLEDGDLLLGGFFAVKRYDVGHLR